MRSITLAITFCLISLSGAVLAQGTDPVTRLIEQLTAQGYQIEEISRTWLGRVRVEAVRGGFEREIVIDPRNGLILRDVLEPEDEDDDEESSSSGGASGEGQGGGGGYSEGGEYGDDDDGDEDDDDDDDDDDEDDDDDDGDDDDGDD